MPNLKFFVDEALLENRREALRSTLPAVQLLLCDALGVAPSACQLAVVPVMSLATLPAVNAELQILPAEDRTSDRLRDLAARLRDLLGPVTGAQVAVRIAQLDPDNYVAIK